INTKTHLAVIAALHGYPGRQYVKWFLAVIRNIADSSTIGEGRSSSDTEIKAVMLTKILRRNVAQSGYCDMSFVGQKNCIGTNTRCKVMNYRTANNALQLSGGCNE